MQIFPITVYGDSILRKKASPILDINDNLIFIIRNMFRTMHNANGIGLAANQIGLDKRIFIIDVSPVEGYEKFKPMTLINPKIVCTSDELEPFEEGCLSIPQLKSDVIRPKSIEISFFDVDMKENKIEVSDLVARVMQHELDHLNGILFIDHLSEESKIMFKKHLNRIKNRKLDVDYPISTTAKYKLKT